MSTTKSILCDHCAKILKGNQNKFTYDGFTLCLDCYHTDLMNDTYCSPVSDSMISTPIIREETDTTPNKEKLNSLIQASIIIQMQDEKNNKKQKELIDKMTLLEEELKCIKEELNCVKEESKNNRIMFNNEILKIYEKYD